jgi:hypothetical protein
MVATEAKPQEPVATKTEQPVTEEPKGEAKAEEPKEPAEIVYEFKAPEGATLDPDAISAFTEFAKAEKLPADLAQKIVEYGLKRQSEIESAQSKIIENQMIKEEAAAIDTLKKDPALGGANFEQTLKLASEGFKKFASKEEMEFINATRLGNRVPMITLFRKVALAMREDGVSKPPSPPPGADDNAILNELYPTMHEAKE